MTDAGTAQPEEKSAPEPRPVSRRAAALLTLGFVLGGALASGGTAILVRNDSIQRVESETVQRAIDSCRDRASNRRVLRKVIEASFADGSETTQLPPDPAVPQPFIDYLQRLINRMGTGDRSAARARLLAQAPALRCTPEGKSIEVPEPDTGGAP